MVSASRAPSSASSGAVWQPITVAVSAAVSKINFSNFFCPYVHTFLFSAWNLYIKLYYFNAGKSIWMPTVSPAMTRHKIIHNKRPGNAATVSRPQFPPHIPLQSVSSQKYKAYYPKNQRGDLQQHIIQHGLSHHPVCPFHIGKYRQYAGIGIVYRMHDRGRPDGT